MKKKFQKTGKTADRKNSRAFKRSAAERDSGFASDSRQCMGSRENDPNWYALNPQLLKDSASFPYAWPLGNRLNVGEYGADLNKGSLPGIMAMNWIPTFGNALDATSPINVASVNVYTKVRHDNSGHANYDHADYMLYLMAMDSVYAFHAWMRRAYGVALTYSNVNRYFPRAAVEAMGVSFGDIQKHLADFRQYINLYAVKASALAIPASMSIMTKHYWMSEGMYFDSNQDKPQTYIFNPLGFYKFVLDGTPAVGGLEFVPLFGDITNDQGVDTPNDPIAGPLTFKQIMEYGDALLAPIIADEDFGIMSGDTLKSFGVGGCYTLPATEETYTVVPSYVPEVLDQIQNATFIGLPNLETLKVTQDTDIGPGGLRTHPKFVHPWVWAPNSAELPGQNAFLVDRFVTFEHGNIDPSNTMEATRWTNIGVQVTEDGTRDYYVPTLGTEVMCTGRIYYFAEINQEFQIYASEPIYVSMNYDLMWSDKGNAFSLETAEGIRSTFANLLTTYSENMRPMNRLIQQIGVFDRHPAIYVTGFCGSNAQLAFYPQNTSSSVKIRLNVASYAPLNGVLFDVNYYTILSSSDLEEMSHIALLSEFDVTSRK
nr:capsid protein [Picobirnavirus sp.]